MTTLTPQPDIERIPRPYRAPGSHDQVSTAPLVGVGAGPRDPLELLDYRTQRQLINAELAPPGRYLAVESRTGLWLFRLAGEATHIGRGLGAQLRVEDVHVSRLHATVTQDADGARLFDGRSLNGTWVDGEQVASTVLCHGDLVEVGRLALRYLEVD